ncbi:MAG: O-antigen ligase family protein, partial [Chthoniobacterales bacterium]
ERAALRFILHGIAAFVFFYAVLAIVARQTGWRPEFAYAFPAAGSFGFLPNRNHTASLLAVGAIVSVGLMYAEATRQKRLSAMLAAVWASAPLAGVLFFSISRAGVVVLALGLVLWCAGLWRRNHVHARGAVFALLALGLVAGGLFVVGGGGSRDRWANLIDRFSGSNSSSGLLDFRTAVFRDTAGMIADAPLTGAGIGQFQWVFPQYTKSAASHFPVVHPESDWLMAAAESGLPFVLCLASLVIWYLVRCWKGLSREGGLLRWTVASAVLAVAAHGLADVPWHRASLGWFLVVAAAATVPSRGQPSGALWLRAATVAIGLALASAGVWMWHETREERFPSAFRWKAMDKSVGEAFRENRHEQGRELARQMTRLFPLDYRTYYWRAVFADFFKDGLSESEQSAQAMLRVNPALPDAAKLQANLFAISEDMEREADALAEWFRRMAKADRANGDDELACAGAKLHEHLYAMQCGPELQMTLLWRFGETEPLAAARVATVVSPDAAETYLAVVPDPASFLTAQPEGLREKILDRWLALPSSSRAIDYMTKIQKAAEPPGPYWRQLADLEAKAGNYKVATELVAGWWKTAEGSSAGQNSTFAVELQHLSMSGNTAAVRRMTEDLVGSDNVNAADLAALMTFHASAGEWEAAWKAASRLATRQKVRH